MSGTGVDVTIGGLPVWNTGAYSITEDSTPTAPDDSSGGYGQIQLPIRDKAGVKSLSGKALTLEDGSQGKTSGIVRGLSGDGLTAQITADSRLGLTAVKRQAQPFVGLLGNAIRYYLGLCGVTSGIVVDSSLESVTVKLPGWNAVVYDQLKKLATARKFEVSLTSSNIVFRPLRTRTAENYRDAKSSWALDESNLAQSVEGYFYDYVSGTQLAYPPGGWNEDVTVYTLNAGETTVLNLDIDASLSSVEQPTCVYLVDRTEAHRSVYAVAGNDGEPIQPAQWLAGGGSVKVEIGDDTKSIKVTITASSETQYAPYRIAVSAGTSDYYSSLRIRGTGVFFNKQKMTLPACLDTDRAPQEIGATVDNEFFETRDQLYHALLRSAARYSSARHTISVQSKSINRSGESGSYVYPTIGELKSLYPGATIGSIRLQPGLGGTIGQWNETLRDLVDGDFVNQAFGNVAGARVVSDDCVLRIRSSTLAPGSLTYTAERDITIKDVFRSGETIGQWNARWAGKTIRDVKLAPLSGLN